MPRSLSVVRVEMLDEFFYIHAFLRQMVTVDILGVSCVEIILYDVEVSHVESLLHHLVDLLDLNSIRTGCLCFHIFTESAEKYIFTGEI